MRLLQVEFRDGDTIVVDVSSDDQLSFRREERESSAMKAA